MSDDDLVLNRWAKSVLDGIKITDNDKFNQLVFTYLTKSTWDKSMTRFLLISDLLLLCLVTCIIFLWFAVFWALQSWNSGGPQWRNIPLFVAVATLWLCARMAPLGGLLMVYGPFLNQVSGRRVSLAAGSWNSEASSLRVAYRWALIFVLPMLVTSAVACATASWIDACHRYFCQDLQVRQFGSEAVNFTAASLFFIHCLVWWRAEYIPLENPLVSLERHLQDHASLRMFCHFLWKVACWAVPLLLGVAFLHLSQPKQVLENMLFMLGCLLFISVAGACSRKLSWQPAWTRALAIFIFFACLRLAVWASRTVAADVMRIDPSTLLSVCTMNDSGACRIPDESGGWKASEANTSLLYMTALPASLALAWEALRPCTDAPSQLSGPWEWILKILLAVFVLGAVATLWGLTYWNEDIDPLAVEIMLFVLTSLLGCFVLRQAHWRLNFWTKIHRPTCLETALEFLQRISERPRANFAVATDRATSDSVEKAGQPGLRRRPAAQLCKVAGSRAKVLHIKKPLPSWPGPIDIMPRLDAFMMILQSTVLPFYDFVWVAALERKLGLCSSVPLLRRGEVTSLVRISLAFLAGKACLLFFVMLAPVMFDEQYVHYHEVEDVAGQMLEQAKHAELEVSFLRDLGYEWWTGTSKMYRHVLILLTSSCSALAFYWWWSGLFDKVDSVFQAFAVWMVTLAQIRKLILYRDAPLGEWCSLQVAAAPWLRRVVSLGVLHGLPAVLSMWSLLLAHLQGRSNISWIILLNLSMVPTPANLLAVSAASLKDSLELNGCLLDRQLSKFVSSSLTTLLTLLAAPGAASLTDILFFTFQSVLQLKSPLDAYALRLKRIGAIATQLAKGQTAHYEPVVFEARNPQKPVPEMRYFGCLPDLSRLEISSATTANELTPERRSFPSLGDWADVELRQCLFRSRAIHA